MARKGGLGPQGRAAVQRAAQVASVQDPADYVSPLESGNPAAITEETNESETLPQTWWSPKHGIDPKRAVYGNGSSRVAEAGYDKDSQRLYVLFHKPWPEGTTWTYEGVPENVWRNMKRSRSAGQYINRVLNQYEYHKGEWG